MLDNPGFLVASILFVFFLAVFVGFMVSLIFNISIIFNDRTNKIGQNPKHERLIKTTITFILTILLTTLVFWINIKIPRKSDGTNENIGPTRSPAAVRPTSTLDDS